MPARIKKSNLLKFVFIIGLVFLIGVVGLFFWRQSQVLEAVSLSEQQQKLVDQFGYPNHFILVFGQMVIDNEYQDVRYEAWSYDQLGRRFNFVDGDFADDTDISFELEAQYPDLKPSYFAQNMTFEEVKNVIGSEPSISADVLPEIAEDMQIYDFHGQVKVGIAEDKVVYIETFPVLDVENKQDAQE